MQSKSEIRTVNGVQMELGIISFQGRDFAANGSVIDEERGLVVGYVGGIPGANRLTTWGGEDIAPLRLVSTYRQRVPGAYHTVIMHAWRAVINGRVYSGRNAGGGMLLRMKAGRKVR